MFKSSKPIPVMLLGIVILGKRYSLAEYFSTGLLTAGLVMFSMATLLERLICNTRVAKKFTGKVTLSGVQAAPRSLHYS